MRAGDAPSRIVWQTLWRKDGRMVPPSSISSIFSTPITHLLECIILLICRRDADLCPTSQLTQRCSRRPILRGRKIHKRDQTKRADISCHIIHLSTHCRTYDIFPFFSIPAARLRKKTLLFPPCTAHAQLDPYDSIGSPPLDIHHNILVL